MVPVRDAWVACLVLERHGSHGLVDQLAAQLRDAVREGRLKASQRLPGARSLANTLGVSRNTVEAAYRELSLEGWLAKRAASGTFVRDDIPDLEPRAVIAGRIADAWTPTNPIEASIAITTSTTSVAPLRWDFGIPDERLFPREEFARAIRRGLRQSSAALRYDRYDFGGRTQKLPIMLCAMLEASRGIQADPSQLLVTRGSQMALYLTVRVLLKPGDRVAVEEPGYPGFHDLCRLVGAQLVPIAVDEDGLCTDALRVELKRGPIRALFTTPHHQFPTTVLLSPARRIELLELADEYGFVVVEDDYDHEFHYDGKPVLPLASSAQKQHVIYVASLSKILAPGLRIGFMVGPRAFIEQANALRVAIELHGDRVLDLAIAELLDEGEVRRHWRRCRNIYQRRREHLVSCLQKRLGDVLTFAVPKGGMAIWAQCATGLDATRWSERALERGLAVRTGAPFFLRPSRNGFLRLGFARLDESELNQCVDTLRAAL